MPQQSQVITYPTPYYNNNIPIHTEFYKPRRFVISDITLGQTTIVETSEDHNYVIGQLIKLFIPKGYGCVQLSGQTGYVIAIPDTDEVEVTIDSSVNVNQFIAGNEDNSPAITPIGDVNTGAINTHGRIRLKKTIPGAFKNIS